MKRGTWFTLTASAALLLFANQTQARELVLKYATLDSPQAHLNVQIHHPWAKKVNADAKGLFRIDVRDGAALANQGNIYNRVLSNVVQIGWGLPLLVRGQFQMTAVVALPYLSDKSEIASVALWRLYKTGLLDKDFSDIVPFKLIVFPQSGLQYRAKPSTLDNLDGLKVIAGSKVISDVVSNLGGAPLSLRIDEYYEALERSTADAVITPWTAFQPFKLAEVTHYHVDAPLGTAPGYVFMAKKQWNALPAAAQKVFEKDSGESYSREFGEFWDEVAKEGEQSTLKKPGQTLLHLTAAQQESWHKRVAPVIEEWAKAEPGRQKVLDTYRKLLGVVAKDH